MRSAGAMRRCASTMTVLPLADQTRTEAVACQRAPACASLARNSAKSAVNTLFISVLGLQPALLHVPPPYTRMTSTLVWRLLLLLSRQEVLVRKRSSL